MSSRTATTPPLKPLGPPGPFPDSPLEHVLDRQWLHYAFLSRPAGQAVIANLSVLGPASDDPEHLAGAPAAESHRMAILLVHERERGWTASQFNAERSAPPWSAFRIPHPRRSRGPFRVAAHTGRPEIDLLMERTSRPCTSQCAPFGEEEHLRWQSEPGVLASGTLRGAGEAMPVDLIGYHERVRGRWSWPGLGGWVFGFSNDPSGPAGEAPPAAVVFTLIQPVRTECANGSVMLWRHGRLQRHFPRTGVRVAVHGQLDRDRVTVVPPLADVLATPPAPPVPGRLLITARTGDDRLVLDFRCETAGRIVNPSETSLRPFSVHEVLGPCVVEGTVSGRPVGFEAMGIVEFAGGAGDD